MSRIPLFPEAGFSQEQRLIYDKIASGPRGVVVGPMRAALHSPELADRWQALGELLRYRSSLPARLSELAILVCGRYWNSEVEWYVHVEMGLRAGLNRDIIEAIRISEPPVFQHLHDATVYEYSRQLLERGHVSEEIYQLIREQLGTIGIVELTALIGYYSMVAMTLNAHNVPLPDENPERLRVLDDVDVVDEDRRPTRLHPAKTVPGGEIRA